MAICSVTNLPPARVVYSLPNEKVFGVVHLPMRNSVCWPVLVIIMGSGAAMAQQPYADYRFRNPDPSVETGVSEPGAGAMNYRWRPLEQEAPDGQPESPPERGPATKGYSYPRNLDYTDEPLGLPRGTYRRIEERHTITPHDKGYRFRPIGPDEQERVKERNANDRQTYTDIPGMNGRGDAYRSDSRPSPPIFRPDKRLDKGTRGSTDRYSYPEGRPLPQFRPYEP
jgi:hypothetical protein